MASNGESLAVAGMSNSQPIFVDMSTIDGTLNKYISLTSKVAISEKLPNYQHFGAIYYDNALLNQSYFYSALLKDNEVFFFRVADDSEGIVDWSYQLVESFLSNPLANLNEPKFITADLKRDSDMFMIGRYRGKGSVINFKKKDGDVSWYA